MKNRNNRNFLMYSMLVIVTIIVYLVIHISFGAISKEIYQCNAGYHDSSIYKVKAGESLEDIAEMYNIPIEKLREANNLKDSDILYPGQEIIIPKDGDDATDKQPINNIITKKEDDQPVQNEKIKLNTNNMTMQVGTKKKLYATVEPYDDSKIDFIWSSSNPSIATVDSDGNVTALKEGTVIITVRTKDGEAQAECIVKVIPNPIVFSYDYDEGNYISLINQFPITDEVGKSLHGDKRTQDFKLRFNENAAGVRYVITAEKLDGSDLDEQWAKLFLVNDGADVANCYRTNNRVKSFDEYQNYNGNTNEKILYEGVITNSEAERGYKDFTFRMWVSEDLNLVNSDYLSETKTFKTRINVYAVGN